MGIRSISGMASRVSITTQSANGSIWFGTRALGEGAHEIKAQFVIDNPVPGSPGTLTLFVDGNADDYTIEYSRFTGRLDEAIVKLK